jgi:filamentous hemagglutinin family protein
MRPVFLFNRPSLLLCLTTGILWLGCEQAIAGAPITPSGLNTQLTQSGQTYNITGGTRPDGGTNLFHSFGDFNVPTNNIANFLNDSGLATSNILGRVTGGNPSTIFGTIQTTGFGNANLFLMNPTGFLFGPKATVNVGGMVAFTSADYLRLANGVLFNATPNPAADALLSAAPVAAFGFLGSNPAAIAVQGSKLAVQPAQSISLVGGNQGFTYTNPDTDDHATVPVPDGVIVTGGQLLAHGGQVNIASVASPGEILAGTLVQAPNVNGQSFGALGSIQVSQQSIIDVSGNGGGTVLIRGGNFVLDNSTISANVTGLGPVVNGVESIGGGIDIVVSQNAEILTGSLLQTNVVGNATPGVTYGDTHIKADRIEIIGDPGFDFDNGPFTEIHSDVGNGSTGGNSGPIKLEANSILLQDFVTLQANTNGPGSGGDIILQTTGNLELNGSSVQTNSGSPGVVNIFGNAGNIELTSTNGNILMTNGAFNTSQAFGSGTPGHIAVNAPVGEVLLSNFENIESQVFTSNQGTSSIPGTGGIQITAKNLTIVDSGFAIDNFTSVQPGNLNVNLTGRLSITNDGATFPHPSVLITATRSEARSANLNITAQDVFLTGNSLIATDTFRNGDAGTLNVSTQSLELTNGAQIRSTSSFNPGLNPNDPKNIIPSGAGGAITIQGLAGPAQTVLIDGASSGIFTNTQGTGAGGNMSISAQSLTVRDGGTLSAATSGTSSASIGGTITVEANQVQLNNGGLITASSTATQAQGGDITITAGQSVTLKNGSSISASSTGLGNAGNILINAGQTFVATNSHDAVTTKADAANGGNITVLATDMVHLTNSQLNASVQGSSTTAGGNITIDPQQVILQNSQIVARATQGQGGAISITITNGGLFLSDASSTVSASSERGLNGPVTIQSPNAPISGQIQPLGRTPLIATTLLNQHCAALAEGNLSSFTVAGRDSLPTEPGSWLASPLATLDAGMGLGAKAEGVRPVARGEGEPPLLSLRQIVPAGFLTQAFAVDWWASCQS